MVGCTSPTPFWDFEILRWPSPLFDTFSNPNWRHTHKCTRRTFSQTKTETAGGGLEESFSWGWSLIYRAKRQLSMRFKKSFILNDVSLRTYNFGWKWSILIVMRSYSSQHTFSRSVTSPKKTYQRVEPKSCLQLSVVINYQIFNSGLIKIDF